MNYEGASAGNLEVQLTQEEIELSRNPAIQALLQKCAILQGLTQGQARETQGTSRHSPRSEEHERKSASPRRSRESPDKKLRAGKGGTRQVHDKRERPSDTHADKNDTHAKLRSRVARKKHEPKVSSKEILSLLTKCPTCGKENRKIPGDPLGHYMTCTKRKDTFNRTTVEGQALALIHGLRRNIKRNNTREDDHEALVQESRRQEKEALKHGERELHSDSPRSLSSEEGVERNSDGYESDPGEDDEDVEDGDDESEESEYLESSETASSAEHDHSSRARNTASSSSLTADLSQQLVTLKRDIDGQKHAQADALELIKQLFSQVKDMSQSMQRLSAPPAHMTVTPRATAHQNSLQASFEPTRDQPQQLQLWSDRLRTSTQIQQLPHRSAALDFSPTHDPPTGQGRTDVPGDQNYPEMEDADLAVATAFEKHKKAYKGYLSKCSSFHRRPVTLAQTFERWAEWLAVIFTEQEKQKAEAAGEAHRYLFDKKGVLLLPDAEFEVRYMEMCGLAMRDPSQVLDFLREQEIDVSSGNITKIIAASEVFRRKLKQIPARSLFATTAERVRNAFIESLFGEEKGKRKRVDFDHLDSWEDVVKLLAKTAAQSPAGLAFEPFKPLQNFKSKKSDKRSPVDTKDAKEEENKDELTAGCDMRITSEKKWYKRYRYFANQNKIPLDQHGGSNSWKTRYAHVVDVVDKKSGRCTLCKQRGHVASACDDPAPDVLYPSKSTQEGSASMSQDRRSEERQGETSSRAYKGQGRDHERERGREQHRYHGRDHEQGRHQQRHYGRDQDQRERSPFQSEERREQRHSHYRDSPNDYRRDQSPRDFRREDRERSPYYRNDRERSPYRGREQSPYQRDLHNDRGRGWNPEERRDDQGRARQGGGQVQYSSPRVQSERQASSSRDSSKERPVTCYKCGYEGHMARECKATKDRDGRHLTGD